MDKSISLVGLLLLLMMFEKLFCLFVCLFGIQREKIEIMNTVIEMSLSVCLRVHVCVEYFVPHHSYYTISVTL